MIAEPHLPETALALPLENGIHLLVIRCHCFSIAVGLTSIFLNSI